MYYSKIVAALKDPEKKLRMQTDRSHFNGTAIWFEITAVVKNIINHYSTFLSSF